MNDDVTGFCVVDDHADAADLSRTYAERQRRSRLVNMIMFLVNMAQMKWYFVNQSTWSRLTQVLTRAFRRNRSTT